MFKDFFCENVSIESLIINKELTHTVTFTAVENKIYMRVHKVFYDDVHI
jgi:hypothetical protein